ncbi:RluA family pseudouridine synthase [Paenibacillus sediminis]|uniref:Pseudouridine synthase n=1 Tax=Paenibacillus sediminis TaxID=664909 RepID=A0ABS4H710_9BACL|nr:23S rRNA pseudouridine1911/1915/1917 synthase [Paenibacillus sediminis]
MSWHGNWKRRGEWLEVTPGREVMASEDRMMAAHQWLARHFGLSDKIIRGWMAENGIQLAGDRLRVRLFRAEEPEYEPYYRELNILYEDDFCLVVHKPAGMLVHPTVKEQHLTLAHAVAAYYESTGQRLRVRHIHRLDEHTSGPVLYAKNDFAHLKLDEAMRVKEIDRTYVAFVQGIVSPELQVIDLPIGKDRHHKQRRRVSPTGQHAVTHVKVVETYSNASLVRLDLDTGRTHQIRVHMSHMGHPLIGDTLYGGQSSLFPYQALHGERLSFPHPLTAEREVVEDPWPDSFHELRSSLMAEE